MHSGAKIRFVGPITVSHVAGWLPSLPNPLSCDQIRDAPWSLYDRQVCTARDMFPHPDNHAHCPGSQLSIVVRGCITDRSRRSISTPFRPACQRPIVSQQTALQDTSISYVDHAHVRNECRPGICGIPLWYGYFFPHTHPDPHTMENNLEHLLFNAGATVTMLLRKRDLLNAKPLTVQISKPECTHGVLGTPTTDARDARRMSGACKL